MWPCSLCGGLACKRSVTYRCNECGLVFYLASLDHPTSVRLLNEEPESEDPVYLRFAACEIE